MRVVHDVKRVAHVVRVMVHAMGVVVLCMNDIHLDIGDDKACMYGCCADRQEYCRNQSVETHLRLGS